jgi:hypothetical protein
MNMTTLKKVLLTTGIACCLALACLGCRNLQQWGQRNTALYLSVSFSAFNETLRF